ncbi:MAG: hypothetical protein AAB355_02240 [Patescibacteria group bacterium]
MDDDREKDFDPEAGSSDFALDAFDDDGVIGIDDSTPGETEEESEWS